MAPFQVGDYLEYSGINIGGTIVCYTIVAPNVQITTSGAPTYIRVEDAIVGIFDGTTTSEFGDSRVSVSVNCQWTFSILILYSSLVTPPTQMQPLQSTPSTLILALARRQKGASALHHTSVATSATSGNGELLLPQHPNTHGSMCSAFPRARSLPTTRSMPAVMSNLSWITSSLKPMFLVLFRL